MTHPAASPDGAGAEPAADGTPPEPAADDTPPEPDRRPRPMIERLGLAVIAVILGSLFALVGVAAFIGGEPFLGVMGVIGCLMVLWVGGLTLFRG